MVLVIDDEQLIIELVGQIIDFESKPHELVTEPDLAIQKIKEKKYKLILLDLHLGQVSGIEVLKEIKESSDSLNIQTPVYIMSGLIEDSEKEQIINHIEGIIPKPFEIDDITKVILATDE